MVSFNLKNTGQGTLQGKDRDSSRAPCEREWEWQGRNHYMWFHALLSWCPTEICRGETFCGKSIPNGAPAENSVRMQEATGA